jgi:5-methylcytosine-specific restriction endonuclease McrA
MGAFPDDRKPHERMPYPHEVNAMTSAALSVLDTAALASRLRDLAGNEREIQADFLLFLAEFDSRRAYLDLGYGSLWDYLLRALHLREGAAARRIAAMKVLRRFPRLEPAMRDGRLCMSTVAALGPVLTEENVGELAARAAWKTKADVDHLIASVQPRAAPREGLRKLPDPGRYTDEPTLRPAIAPTDPDMTPPAPAPAEPANAEATQTDEISSPRAEPAPARPRTARAEISPVSKREWSLRVTLDHETKEELERLRVLLGHKIPNGDLAAVLREAIRCATEKHGKRKGAVAPAKPRRSPERKPATGPGQETNPRTIPAGVRRQEWERDGGACAWIAPDGTRCGSTWMLELDHIRPVALGGTSTLENLRVSCRPHNVLHAEHVYGSEHMEKFRRERSRSGESTAAGGRSGAAP